MCSKNPPTTNIYPPVDVLVHHLHELLYKCRGLHWEAFQYHFDIQRIGEWISHCSLAQHKIPPISVFCLIQIIKKSLFDGIFRHIIPFLKGYLSKIPDSFRLPHPYLLSILKCLASIYFSHQVL